jgi:hypothetical protein
MRGEGRGTRDAGSVTRGSCVSGAWLEIVSSSALGSTQHSALTVYLVLCILYRGVSWASSEFFRVGREILKIVERKMVG